MSAQATKAGKFGKTRKARGFSRGELGEAGLDFAQALRLRLPIDMRRKTKRVENVKTLKQFLRKK
jgi:ribosomal protein L13E